MAYSALTVKLGPYQGEWLQYWGNYSTTDNASVTDFVLPVFMNVRMQEGKLKPAFAYYDRLGFLMEVDYTLTPPSGS